MGLEAFLINPMGKNKPKRKVVKIKTRTKARTTPKKRSSPKKKRTTRPNPLAGVGKLMLVGGNPRMTTTNRPKRKRRATTKKRSGGYSMALRSNAPKRARRRVKRSSTTVKRVRYYNAPKKSRRGRKMRRNPANPMISMPKISLKKPQTLLMPIGVGIAGYMITDKIPGMFTGPLDLPMKSSTKTMLQLGVCVGGGLAMVPLIGNVGAVAWVAASGAAALSGVINTWLAKMQAEPTPANGGNGAANGGNGAANGGNGGTSGIGYVPYPALPGAGYDLNLGGVGAFPQEAMW